jgi:hypothetical protein
MYNTDTEHELELLEKSLDELGEKMNELAGGDVIAKDEGDDGNLSDADVAELSDSIDELETELDGEMNKFATRTWEELVAKVAADESLPMHAAMQKARRLYPEQFEHYNAAGVAIAKSAAAAAQPPVRRDSEFMSLARHLQVSKNLSGMDALQQARKVNPDAFAEYQRQAK